MKVGATIMYSLENQGRTLVEEITIHREGLIEADTNNHYGYYTMGREITLCLSNNYTRKCELTEWKGPNQHYSECPFYLVFVGQIVMIANSVGEVVHTVPRNEHEPELEAWLALRKYFDEHPRGE